MTLSQHVHDRKFPSSLPRAKPSTAKPRKRTIREQAIDWIRESPPTAQGGLTPAERETLYELTNWFPKVPSHFKVTPHIASRDFPSGYVRGVLDNLGGITRHSFLQRMKSLTDKGYVRKVKHGYGSRSGYTTLTAWELLADPAPHLRKQFQEEMDFRTADAYAHEQSSWANKPSPMSKAEGLTPMPMSRAEGLSGVYKEDHSLHDSLTPNACMQQSESNEKSDDGRVLKIAPKRQFTDDSTQQLVDLVNDYLNLGLTKCVYCGYSDYELIPSSPGRVLRKCLASKQYSLPTDECQICGAVAWVMSQDGNKYECTGTRELEEQVETMTKILEFETERVDCHELFCHLRRDKKKRQTNCRYVPGGCKCNLNDSQHLLITERRVERTIPKMEYTTRVEACDNYERTEWHCSRMRDLDEPLLVRLEDFANHAGGDSPLTEEEKNHMIDAMTIAGSKDPIRSPKAFIGGILGNIAIGEEDVGRYARNSNRTNRATTNVFINF